MECLIDLSRFFIHTETHLQERYAGYIKMVS